MILSTKKILNIAIQDLTFRYAGTAIGNFWLLAQPVLQSSVYIILYTFIFRVSVPGLSSYGYLVFLLLGIAIVLDISETILLSITSIRSSLTSISQNIYPINCLPLRFCVQTKPQLLVISYLAIVLAPILGVQLHPYCLVVPIFTAVLLLAFEYGFVCLLLPVAAVLKDIQQVLQYVIQFIVILSPFSYTRDMLSGVMKIFLYFNPLSPFIRLNQSIMTIFDPFSTLLYLFLSITLALLFLFFGQRVYLASLSLILDEAA